MITIVAISIGIEGGSLIVYSGIIYFDKWYGKYSDVDAILLAIYIPLIEINIFFFHEGVGHGCLYGDGHLHTTLDAIMRCIFACYRGAARHRREECCNALHADHRSRSFMPRRSLA